MIFISVFKRGGQRYYDIVMILFYWAQRITFCWQGCDTGLTLETHF